MKRLVAAALLLALPGLAGALEISTGDVTVDPWVPGPIVIPPLEITPVRFEFVDPIGHAAAVLSAQPPRPALIGDLMLLGETVILAIDEDGVRLPDEQFSLD